MTVNYFTQQAMWTRYFAIHASAMRSLYACLERETYKTMTGLTFFEKEMLTECFIANLAPPISCTRYDVVYHLYNTFGSSASDVLKTIMCNLNLTWNIMGIAKCTSIKSHQSMSKVDKYYMARLTHWVKDNATKMRSLKQMLTMQLFYGHDPIPKGRLTSMTTVSEVVAFATRFYGEEVAALILITIMFLHNDYEIDAFLMGSELHKNLTFLNDHSDHGYQDPLYDPGFPEPNGFYVAPKEFMLHYPEPKTAWEKDTEFAMVPSKRSRCGCSDYELGDGLECDC